MATRSLPPIDFKALGQTLLPMADTLVPAWLPGGARRGHEYVCGSLAGGSGSSCSVNLTTGQWADFSGDEKGGDLVSLYQAIHGLSPVEAARELADAHGLHDVARIVKRGDGAAPPRPPPPPAPPPASPARDREQWTPIVPVPPPPESFAPTFWHSERKNPVHKAAYRVGADLYGYVVRFIDSKGDKVTMPYVWASSSRDGSRKWQWRGWDEPRPLFFPGAQRPAGRTVVVVEGEIKAEVLQQLLDAHAAGVYCVASWPNGSKSWRKADWSWLAGSTVLLWADCDSKRVELTKAEREACGDDEVALEAERAAKPYLAADKQPGKAAMLGIGALLRDVHGCQVSMLPCEPPGVRPDGWDARDAIEKDGWGIDEVLGYFAQAVVLLAQDGPEAAVDAASGAGGGGRKKIDLPAGAGGGGDGGGGTPWWLAPFWHAKKGYWMVSRKLVIAALTHDPALAGVVSFNQLTNEPDALRPWPWAPDAALGPVAEMDVLLLGDYLSETYGLPSIPTAALNEAIDTVGYKNRRHPVRHYLEGLRHDGRERLDKWLIYVLGETPESLTASAQKYLRLVGRFWVLGMVNRAMSPGCKFDYCPVLEGKGGLRKSTLVEVLTSTAWYSATPFDVSRGKEGQEQVQGRWGYELGELSQFSKSTIQMIKTFISEKVDRYRQAYARRLGTFPRQCVMVGTTNEKTYLRDRTGNRRFWPVATRHRIDTEWVERNRDQLFAEAMAAYRKGERFTPTQEEEDELFVPRQQLRMVETSVQSDLLRLLTRDPDQSESGKWVNNLTDFVTLSHLVRALSVDPAKAGAGLDREVSGWLEAEGWIRGKRQINGVRAWGYSRPRGWPSQNADEEVDDFIHAPEASVPPAHPSAPVPPLTPAAAWAAEQEDADDAPF